MDLAGIRIRPTPEVIGIDEVGRGSLAGPLVVVAARARGEIPASLLERLDDSKRLTAEGRQALLTDIAAVFETAEVAVPAWEIDRVGMADALASAMTTVAARLSGRIVIVDGAFVPAPLRGQGIALVKADTTEPSVAAASVWAKEARDAAMRRLAETHPAYGWEDNAGYGSARHRQAILAHGATAEHRLSFLSNLLPGWVRGLVVDRLGRPTGHLPPVPATDAVSVLGPVRPGPVPLSDAGRDWLARRSGHPLPPGELFLLWAPGQKRRRATGGPGETNSASTR